MLSSSQASPAPKRKKKMTATGRNHLMTKSKKKGISHEDDNGECLARRGVDERRCRVRGMSMMVVLVNLGVILVVLGIFVRARLADLGCPGHGVVGMDRVWSNASDCCGSVVCWGHSDLTRLCIDVSPNGLNKPRGIVRLMMLRNEGLGLVSVELEDGGRCVAQRLIVLCGGQS